MTASKWFDVHSLSQKQKTKKRKKNPKNKKKRCMRIYLFHFIEENLCNTYKCTHDSTLKLKRSTWILFFKLTRITCMYIPLNVYGIYIPNNFFRYTETHVVYACIIYERAYKSIPLQMPVYRKYIIFCHHICIQSDP